jgi:tetratricopeptide (TPR) repeat protein
MLKTRFFSICIFLCAILSTNRIIAADNFSNALRIFSERKFFAASIEFERVIYYESDNNIIAKCKYYKALCYNELDEHAKALEELSEINIHNLPDSLFFLIKYEQALCNYLNNDPNQSLLNIDELRFSFPDSSKTIEIIPLNIICLNALRRWDEALDKWNFLIDNSELDDSVKNDLRGKVLKIYSKKSIPKFHSPKKAENLSRFIPGSGQMYSGAVLEGTFNLLMNASILTFSFYEFYSKYYFTGYLVGLGIFNKTYHGGMRRANLLAVERNQEGIRKFNLSATALLLNLIDSGSAGNVSLLFR